jgi:hypothetical protein
VSWLWHRRTRPDAEGLEDARRELKRAREEKMLATYREAQASALAKQLIEASKRNHFAALIVHALGQRR